MLNNLLNSFVNKFKGDLAVAVKPLIDSNSNSSSLNYSKLLSWPYVLPLPNEHLIGTVSYGTLEQFYHIGEAWAYLVTQFLPENPKILDLGCGCGKLARFLYLNPLIQYIGIDIYLPSIEWCKQAFDSLNDNRFRFEHFDGHSTVWNPNGKIQTVEYIFPLENNTINFVIGASLFTHTLEDECKHYLSEINRVLSVNGLVLVSIHDEPKDDLKYSGDHSRIDIDFDYFIKLAKENSLEIKKDIGNFMGQRVLLFEKI